MAIPSKLKDKKFLLIAFLRLIGGTLLLATLTIFLPVSLMESTHQMLRVGDEFPRQPIVVYLARSTSALYALHGAMILLISFDIDRYLKLVYWIGGLHLVLGLIILVTDLLAPMPLYWTLLEGPPVMAGAVLLIYLANIYSRSRESADNG